MTIAGSDPSGGAGLQADLKTFHQHGVYGMSVVTLLTVQNTRSVSAVETLDPELVVAQLDAVTEDITPLAAKTGALGGPEIIEVIAAKARVFDFPLVIDPVMISKHGAPLMSADAAEIMRQQLLPSAFLVTPNLSEASALTGRTVDSIETMKDAAREIAALGPANVLVKGGHLDGDAVDILLAGETFIELRAPRIPTTHTHGTGCVTSAAITARLAKGESVTDAVRGAKDFITRAIETHPGLGNGYGPVNLFVSADDR